jgi:hypothetical protein
VQEERDSDGKHGQELARAFPNAKRPNHLADLSAALAISSCLMNRLRASDVRMKTSRIVTSLM